MVTAGTRALGDRTPVNSRGEVVAPAAQLHALKTDHNKIVSRDTAAQRIRTAHQCEGSLGNQSNSDGLQVTQLVPGFKMWLQLTASVAFKVLGHRHGVQAVAPYAQS